MIDDLVDNLQIKLLEGPHSLINFALSEKFDQHLSLPRSARRIWEKLERQRIITSQSVVQLPEHLPKNRPFGFLTYKCQKRIVFELFFGAVVRVICFASPQARSMSVGESSPQQ